MVAKFVVLIFASLLLQDAVSSEQVSSDIPRAQHGAVVAKNNENSTDQPMDWGKIWNWNVEKGFPVNSEPKFKPQFENDFPINNRAVSDDARGNPPELARDNNASGSNFVRPLPQKIRNSELDPRDSVVNRNLVNLRNQFNNKANRKYESEEYNFDEIDDENESYDSLMSESSQMYEDDVSPENDKYNKDYEFSSRIGKENQRYTRPDSMSRSGAAASPSSLSAINYSTQIEQPVMQTRSLQMQGVRDYGRPFDSVSM